MLYERLAHVDDLQILGCELHKNALHGPAERSYSSPPDSVTVFGNKPEATSLSQ